MRRQIILLAFIACTLTGLRGSTFAPIAQAPDSNGNGPPQIIEVAAKKYEFTPSEIRVKKGTRVEIKVHSLDETHGIKLDLYAEGSKDKSSPGLIFEKPEDNGKVEKNQDQILDFVAREAGTYEFRCAKVCGIHHGSMKGTLVVEE